jgi:aspartokinase
MGGACLMLDKERLTILVDKILSDSKNGKIIFVVSALSGVTRLLGEAFLAEEESHPKEEIDQKIKYFADIHFRMIDRLITLKEDKTLLKEFVVSLKNDLSNKLNSKIKAPRNHASILVLGELASSCVFSFFLKQIADCRLIDARNLIIVEKGDYLNSKPNFNSTFSKVKKCFLPFTYNIIVTQGYISSDIDDEDHVLGFDGSDLSVAILADCFLKMENYVSLTYWKDVLGVMKNPQNIKDGFFGEMRIIEYLDFSEKKSVPVRTDAIRLFLSYLNLKVLKIQIRSFLELENPGTIIRN